MITKETIIEAYLFLRNNNQSIPDETLDFMKETSLKALEESKVKNINVIQCCETLKAEKPLDYKEWKKLNGYVQVSHGTYKWNNELIDVMEVVSRHKHYLKNF